MSQAKEQRYQVLPISELKPYANNARTHGDKQIAQLVGSIQEFGFTNPILIDEGKSIIAGHGRLEAATLAGLDDVPCVILSGLSDEQKKALVIADNQLALNAGWDLDMLKAEVMDLGENDFDLDLLGFDAGFLDGLLAGCEDEDGLTDEDECPEAPEEPITKMGDVWLCGKHRVMCGDSTSIDDVKKLMDGEKADLVFTDPPYGMKKENEGVLNDNLNYDDLLEFNRQ